MEQSSNTTQGSPGTNRDPCSDKTTSPALRLASQSNMQLTQCSFPEDSYVQQDAIFEPALTGIGLILMLQGTPHEVDSIVDCKEFKQKQHQQFKLDMCCDCCKGRSYWYSAEVIFNDGNTALKELAKQTLDLHRAGLEICQRQLPSASKEFLPSTIGGTSFFQADDDFEMSFEDSLAQEQEGLGVTYQVTQVHQPRSGLPDRQNLVNCNRFTFQSLQDNPGQKFLSTNKTVTFSDPHLTEECVEEQAGQIEEQISTQQPYKQQINTQSFLQDSQTLDKRVSPFSQGSIVQASAKCQQFSSQRQQQVSCIGQKQTWNEKQWDIKSDSFESSDERTAPEDSENFTNQLIVPQQSRSSICSQADNMNKRRKFNKDQKVQIGQKQSISCFAGGPLTNSKNQSRQFAASNGLNRESSVGTFGCPDVDTEFDKTSYADQDQQDTDMDLEDEIEAGKTSEQQNQETINNKEDLFRNPSLLTSMLE